MNSVTRKRKIWLIISLIGFTSLYLILGIILREFTLDILESKTTWAIWAFTLIVFIGCLLISLIRKITIYRQMKNFSNFLYQITKEANSISDDKDNNSVDDKLGPLLYGVRLYTIILFFDLLVLTLFSFYHNATIAFGIIFAFLLGLLTVSHLPFEEKTTHLEGYKEITMEDYPHLYALVHKVAKDVNLNNQIVIIAGEGKEILVECIKKTIYVKLGMVLMLLINEKSLTSILYFELTKLYQELHSENRFFQRHLGKYLFQKRFESEWRLFQIIGFLYYPFTWKIAIKARLLTGVSAISYESKASEMVNEKGDPQALINAMAIIESYHTFAELPLENPLFPKNETTPNDYLYQLRDRFYEHFNSHLDMYRYFIDHGLDQPFLPYGSVGKMMKELKIDHYDFDTTIECSSPYKQDVDKLVTLYNHEWAKHYADKYTLERKCCYERYVDQIKNTKEEELTESYDISYLAYAYQKIGEQETAVKLYKKAMALDASNYFAIYHYGVYLLCENDGDGVTYLKRAITANRNYLIKGLDILNAYFLRNGLLDDYMEFTDSSMRWIEESSIEDKDEAITLDTIFISDTLKEEDYEKFIKVAKSHPIIKEIRIIAHYSRDNRIIHRVALIFDYENEVEMRNVYDSFYYLLDNFNHSQTQFYLETFSLKENLSNNEKIFFNPLVKIIYKKEKI